jgi:GR25 family glycosyltransferase involved in LPS biosynthesis
MRRDIVTSDNQKPMHIYVINLDRSQDRMTEFSRINKHMPEIQRHSAADGSKLDREELVRANIIAPDLAYTPGAIGCALSHIFFWEAAVTQKTQITICEDDAIFHRTFSAAAPKLLASLPPDWDLVMWGWNFDSILMFDLMPGISQCLGTFNQELMREAANEFQSASLSPQLFRLLRGFGTVCYTISEGGAHKLMARSIPLRPITVSFPRINPAFPNNGIDIVMNDAYPELNAYVSFPPLVITKNEHEVSTVLPGA